MSGLLGIHRKADADHRDGDDRSPAQPDPAQQSDSGEEKQHGRESRPLRRPRPDGEVEEDSCAAREREQREDEADEVGVEAERGRDPAADAGDQAIVGAACESRDRHSGQPVARSMSISPTPTFASTTSTGPPAGVDGAFRPDSTTFQPLCSWPRILRSPTWPFTW